MSLLVDIATQALDPGYADAAARRTTSPGPPGRRRPLLVALAVVGATLLIVLAGVQAHRRAPVTKQSRASLVASVQRQSAAVSALERRLNLMRGQTTRLRDRLLASTATGAALSQLLAREEVAAGTSVVTGPGLQVRLTDATDTRDGGNRVLDRDVQSIVNALWAAGAEAVAVNGQRLTAQSAIRQAGDAILVNFAPIGSPYVIDAVGDPVAMETSFGASRAAGRMRTLGQLYGLGFDYRRVSDLTLPSAPGLTVRYAKPVASTIAGARP